MAKQKQQFYISTSGGMNEQVVFGSWNLIMQIIWGFLFFSFSTNDKRFGFDKCGELRQTSYIYSIFCFASSVILCCYLIPYSNSANCQKNRVLSIFNLVFWVALLIISIGFLIAMTVAYSKRNPCKELSTLTLSYIIIETIYIGIIVLFLLLVFMIAYQSKKGAEFDRNEKHYLQQDILVEGQILE